MARCYEPWPWKSLKCLSKSDLRIYPLLQASNGQQKGLPTLLLFEGKFRLMISANRG